MDHDGDYIQKDFFGQLLVVLLITMVVANVNVWHLKLRRFVEFTK